jgi:predicted nucleic acid-binding Zn ribbon protein
MAQQQKSVNLKSRSLSQSNLKDEINFLLKGIREESKRKYAFWEEVMGDKIAKVAVPVKNKKGILFIKVQDATWRFELTRRKIEINRLLNEHFKKDIIKDIVFI